MTTQTKAREVRMELMAGEEADAIARAIEETNPAATVEYYPGLTVIRAPGRILITREAVERELGRPFNLRDIQTLMAAYYGYWKDTSSDQWLLEWLVQ